eukprot:gnl/Chilomastix_caulleri/602.p1 GENE.gnl/Chilomastix_caulleri/602~~gnl/Chilomastix_caulleri/602.p1  ORF type:complete len:412 (+),score=164.71 gnl/Chilomastix_caulleri/602:51-1286(+)
MGIHYSDPRLKRMRYVGGTEIENELTGMKRDGGPRPSIVVIGLSNNYVKTYKDVKKVCSRFGVVSQCINMSNLGKAIERRRADSYLWGLFQQMCSKVGAVVWRANVDVPTLTKAPFMLCGIHYVPPPSSTTTKGGAMQFSSSGQGEGQSGFLSMCTSHDPTMVRHFNQCRPVNPMQATRGGSGIGVEKELASMMDGALRFAGYIPKKLIVLRSGLPEGETEETVANEIKVIKNSVIAALVKYGRLSEEAAEKQQPKLTYIVARRRCNARFINGRENPVPGTYVDDGRMVVGGRDFFMISGFTPKRGPNDAPCTKPVLYSIRLNESEDLPRESIMKLMFHTSFNYVNYPGPQSLPITLRYAVSMAQHVSEKTGYAPPTTFDPFSINPSPSSSEWLDMGQTYGDGDMRVFHDE